MLKCTLTFLSRLHRNERGNFAMLFTLLIPVLFGLMGLAVDYSRTLDARQKLSNSMEGAVLAAAQVLSENDNQAYRKKARKAANAYLNGNLKTLFARNDVKKGKVSLKIDTKTQQIKLTSSIEVRTAFMSIFGTDKLKASFETASTYSNKLVEVVFVLDVTGSMGWSDSEGVTKMTRLKNSVNNALDILIDENDQNSRIRIGIVPYADTVNLGETYAIKALGRRTPQEVNPRFDNYCVSERESEAYPTVNPYTYSDIAPANVDHDDATAAELNTFFDIDGVIGDEGAVVNAGHSSRCPNPEILPLTKDKKKLTDLVNSLTPDGFTAGHIGISWGYYMLLPNWKTFWGPDSAPNAFNKNKHDKYLVVMTDGTFNTAWYDKESYDYELNDALVSGQWFTHNDRSIWQAHNSQDKSEEATKKFCDLAKRPNQNIKVYTIAFAATQAANNLLRDDCSSQIPNKQTHYEANSAAALDTAFSEIAEDIRAVYLTQ